MNRTIVRVKARREGVRPVQGGQGYPWGSPRVIRCWDGCANLYTDQGSVGMTTTRSPWPLIRNMYIRNMGKAGFYDHSRPSRLVGLWIWKHLSGHAGHYCDRVSGGSIKTRGVGRGANASLITMRTRIKHHEKARNTKYDPAVFCVNESKHR